MARSTMYRKCGSELARAHARTHTYTHIHTHTHTYTHTHTQTHANLAFLLGIFLSKNNFYGKTGYRTHDCRQETKPLGDETDLLNEQYDTKSVASKKIKFYRYCHYSTRLWWKPIQPFSLILSYSFPPLVAAASVYIV